MYWRSYRSSRPPSSSSAESRVRPGPPPTLAPLTKFILFTSNCFFWLISVCLLLAGLYAWFKKGTILNMGRMVSERTLFFDPAWFLITLSTFAAIVSLLGCVGVLRENSRFLLAYIWIVSIAFIAEFCSLTTAYMFKNEAKKHFGLGMLESLKKYHDDEDLQDLVDWVQAKWLRCCGVQNYRDWEINAYHNCSSAVLGNVMACGVPFSCCRTNSSLQHHHHHQQVLNRQCGFGMLNDSSKLVHRTLSTLIYTEGCLNRLVQWFEDWSVVLVCVGIAVGLIQLVGIGFAYSLKTKIKEQRKRHQRLISVR